MNNKEIAGRDSPMTLADQFKWMSMDETTPIFPQNLTDGPKCLFHSASWPSPTT